MKTAQRTDPRSAAQQLADAAVAAGNWDGFETEQLLTEEGAAQILEHRQNLAREREVDPSAALGFVKSQPFRWRDKVFRILRCDYVNGQALVEVAPSDPEFVAELTGRIERDRFHHLNVYLGFGFSCFPEDYLKYRD
jgi:hypothetical protein